MKGKQTKAQKAKRVVAPKRSARKHDPQTLTELNAWFRDNWDLVVDRAKANNVRLTGQETL